MEFFILIFGKDSTYFLKSAFCRNNPQHDCCFAAVAHYVSCVLSPNEENSPPAAFSAAINLISQGQITDKKPFIGAKHEEKTSTDEELFKAARRNQDVLDF